jgi:FHA domain
MPIQCQVCHYNNVNGALICENCGSELVTGALGGASTRKLDRTEMAQAIVSAGQNTSLPIAPGTLLRFEVAGNATPILIVPREVITVGRRDPQSGNLPDVDLTPFAGYRMGVSRNHATLNIDSTNRMTVQDLGSSNGTFLNGVRLTPHSRYRVQHGDEIRFGQLGLRVLIAPQILDHDSEAVPNPHESTGTDNG